MQNSFNLPSVDHLIEGIHYTVVDWNFAEDTEANILRQQKTNMPSRGMASTFAEDCPEGERMIFGKCRATKKDGDWDSSRKTKDEEEGEAQAKKEGSEFKNNKMITDIKTGKKMGWAMKNGKPVLVSWGSVAGIKPVGPKQPAPKAAKAPKPQKLPKGATKSGVTDTTRAAQLVANDKAAAQQVNEAGRKAQEQNRRNILSQTRSS